MVVECVYEGRRYLSGLSWRNEEECSDCFCHHGVTSCKPVKCDLPLDCSLARPPPGSECCPVCDGRSRITYFLLSHLVAEACRSPFLTHTFSYDYEYDYLGFVLLCMRGA
jgi:hypothetical protein